MIPQRPAVRLRVSRALHELAGRVVGGRTSASCRVIGRPPLILARPQAGVPQNNDAEHADERRELYSYQTVVHVVLAEPPVVADDEDEDARID